MRLADTQGNALFTLAVELRAVRLTPASATSIGRIHRLHFPAPTVIGPSLSLVGSTTAALEPSPEGHEGR